MEELKNNQAAPEAVDTEVPLERRLHQTELLEDLLCCELVRNLLERNMTCRHTYLETVAHHDHRDLVDLELLLQVFSMSCVSESLLVHSPLVERSCHENVNMSFLDVLYRSLESCERGLCRLRSRLSWLHEDILRKTVHDVDSLLVDVLCRGDHVCVDLFDVVDLLLVEAEYL